MSTVSPPAEEEPPGQDQDQPVDGWFAWVVVFGVFLINAHTWGLNSAYSVFLSFYINSDLFPGASSIQFAYIGGLSISLAFLVSPIATFSGASNSPRKKRGFLLLGTLIEAVSFIAASFATQTWHLFLTQGVCFGVGMGLLYVGTAGCLPQWFQRHLGLANSTASTGAGVGGLVYSYATNALIARTGFATTLRILGILAFCFNSAGVFMIRDRRQQQRPPQTTMTLDNDDNNNNNTKQKVTYISLLCDWRFVVFSGFGVFSVLAYIICLFSLPSFAASIGLSSTQGSTAAALLSVGQIIGRPMVGHLSDRFDRFLVAAAVTFAAAVLTFALWINVHNYAALIALSILLGTVAGTYFAVMVPMLKDILGFDAIPKAISLSFLILVLPSTFSEAIALEITSKMNNNFIGAQVLTGAMYTCGAICALALYVLNRLGVCRLPRY